MCAQYLIRADLSKLEKLYGIRMPDEWESIDWKQRIVPRGKAPVVLSDKKGLHVVPMEYSLVPSWSKTDRPKFATYNARVESVAEKPTWRDSFRRRRCLVPLTDFIEPIYDGAHAGQMVAFQHKESEILFAAGLWDRWESRDGEKELHSFAIITDIPDKFVDETGHDRMPIFLAQEQFHDWLVDSPVEQAKLHEILQDKQALELTVKKDRDMRPGWEKRK